MCETRATVMDMLSTSSMSVQISNCTIDSNLHAYGSEDYL